MSDFAAHFSATFSRHLAAVGPKELAFGANTNLTTIYRYARGMTPTAETLSDLDKALRRHGRDGFLNELFGLEDAAHWWFVPTGSLCPAREGLDPAARGHLRLHIDVPGDAAAAYRRTLGAVSLSVRGADVEIHYHERSLSPEAAQACAGWLGGRQAIVRRKVDLEERDGSVRTAEMPPEMPEDAGRAVILAAKLARLPAPAPWRVDRLPTDGITSPQAQAIAHIWSAGPSDPLHELGQAGLIPWCSIIQRRDGVLHGVRTGYGVALKEDAKQTMLGPMSVCPDVRYIDVLKAAVPETLTEGLTFRRVRGNFLGQPVDYLQSAIGVGDTYLSCSTEIERAA